VLAATHRQARCRPMDAHALIREFGSPLYVYDLDVVQARCRALRSAVTWKPFQIYFAVKANPCPAVVRTIIAEGFGIDAVSPGEVALGLKLGLRPEQILYTENSMTDAEQAEAMRQRVLINCGSIDRLERLAAAGVRECAMRFNPDIGDGAHEKICTAGPLTKFGVHYTLVEQVRAIEQRTGIKVIGAHMHIGSGFLESEAFAKACGVIFELAARLPNLRFVDCGGGIGIPYRADQRAMDLPTMGARLSADMAAFCKRLGRPLELHLEPGRFLVAESGTLFCTVTSVKENPDGRVFVGTDTGFNHLVRVAMYDAYHRIDNITRPNAPLRKVDVVGNICESGDIFARDRMLPMPQLGDVLAIRDAGAYGMAMASTYNLRPLPAEVVLSAGKPRLARSRQRVSDILDAWIW
ncbi:MAG: diaminopimelate decarboxylase, partial [Planctomycetota bacterium]